MNQFKVATDSQRQRGDFLVEGDFDSEGEEDDYGEEDFDEDLIRQSFNPNIAKPQENL